jgi:uncharacterized protein with NRDE domain
MCVCFLALNQSKKFPLIVLFNRDEYFERESLPLSKWNESQIVAGLDVRSQGTWMGVDTQGRFAAVTHFRNPVLHSNGKQPRGSLVPMFLNGSHFAHDFLEGLEKRKDDFNGFNLLVGDGSGIFSYSNRDPGVKKISAGVYGLSNGFFDADWPKVRKGKKLLNNILTSNDETVDTLLDILLDDTLALESELPETGVGMTLEKLLSPIFVKSEIYGTRTSTLLIKDSSGRMTMQERTFKPGTLQYFQSMATP